MSNKFLNKRYKKQGYKGKYLKLRVHKQKESMLIGLIVFISFMIGLCSFLYLPYVDIGEIYTRQIAKIYESNSIVVSIAEVCSNLDEEEKQGGCCRDYTNFYFSIFSVMGYESEFVFESTHVYLKVFGEKNN